MFTFTRTGDRGRLRDVEGCCLRRPYAIKYHESLVRRVGGLIYVPAIARLRSALPRSRAGGYPTI